MARVTLKPILGGNKGKPPLGSKKGRRCETRYCRNNKAKKSDGYLLRYCWKCKSRQLLQKCPATYVLNMLRHSARKRKLPFTITLDEFKKFCKLTGYLELRGNQPDSMTVDRKNHDQGYHIWNIQLSTHADNSRNGHAVPGRFTRQNERRSYTPPEGHPF